MIRSFADKATEDIFNGVDSKAARRIDLRVWNRAVELLEQLDDATALADMAAPPSNKLHPLKADRKGQHAVYITMKYRVCFHWTEAGPEDVEIVDYH